MAYFTVGKYHTAENNDTPTISYFSIISEWFSEQQANTLENFVRLPLNSHK